MLDLNTLPMRIAVGQIRELTDEIILFTKQMGIQDIQFNYYGGSPYLPGEKRWEYMDLVRLRTRVEDAGLRLNAIENVPIKFYDQIMLGLPGRDEHRRKRLELRLGSGASGSHRRCRTAWHIGLSGHPRR